MPLIINRVLSRLGQVHYAVPRSQKSALAITAARYSLHSTLLPLVQDALPFAELVRRALIHKRVDTSHSQAIVGKTLDGAPLAGHLHAHYLATDEDRDGRIDHITLYAECGFDPSDVAALGALTVLDRRRYGNRPDVRMVLTGLGSGDDFRQTPLFASSKCWKSVTPFSLPRFASRGGGKPARPRDLPKAQLLRELRVRGLPEPISIKPIEGYYAAAGRPLVRWLDFHTRRFKGDAGYGLAGFEIEFADAVRGPIALGFASHFSLGLFVPSDFH